MKDVNEMTRKEFLEIENFKPTKPFNSIIIVPTNYTHDSGYQCMKFILTGKYQEIVGALGGGSDVIHVNGIGGYGKNPDYINRMIKAHDLRIDCLYKSKCLRLFSDEEFEIDNFICSDFIFYFKNN